MPTDLKSRGDRIDDLLEMNHNCAIPRRGVSAIYTVVMLVTLCGFVSLGVDIGHVQLAKTELQTAADAAVRAAAEGLATSIAQARGDALAVAAANSCDGSAVTLDAALDVEVGTWNAATRTFMATNNSPSAVRVTARRAAARNTAIPLSFARLVGKNSCDVSASAIATYTQKSSSGFIGLSSVTMKNNAFFGSYKSSVTTSPTEGTASSNCMLGTNGAVTAKNNDTLKGDLWLGPSATGPDGLSVTGSVVNRPSPIATPTSPAWSPGTNPGSIPRNYTVNSNTTLPGGAYWFTSLTIDADLSFSGPATVYVNGNISIDATLTASAEIPSNLKIYQIGAGRTFSDSKSNSISVTAQVEAPETAFVAKNNVVFKGSCIFNTIETKNNGDFFYDESDGPAPGGASVSMVK